MSFVLRLLFIALLLAGPAEDARAMLWKGGKQSVQVLDARTPDAIQAAYQSDQANHLQTSIDKFEASRQGLTKMATWAQNNNPPFNCARFGRVKKLFAQFWLTAQTSKLNEAVKNLQNFNASLMPVALADDQQVNLDRGALTSLAGHYTHLAGTIDQAKKDFTDASAESAQNMEQIYRELSAQSGLQPGEKASCTELIPKIRDKAKTYGDWRKSVLDTLEQNARFLEKGAACLQQGKAACGP